MGLGFAIEYSAMEPAALAERFNREMLGDRWDALPERTREMLRAEGVAFHWDLVSQLHRPFDVDDVKCPVVVGCGSETHATMEQAMRTLAARTDGDSSYRREPIISWPLTPPMPWLSWSSRRGPGRGLIGPDTDQFGGPAASNRHDARPRI